MLNQNKKYLNKFKNNIDNEIITIYILILINLYIEK